MSSLLEKDAGFCSGSSEHEDDQHHSHDDLHSPTDTEDSVEVKFTPISKNKRKSSEPSRVISDPEQGPLKKRFRYENKTELATQLNNNSCFRPWAPSPMQENKLNPADIFLRHPGVTTLHRAPQLEQEKPLALLTKKPSIKSNNSQETEHVNINLPNEPSIESLIKKTQIRKLLHNTSLSSSTSVPISHISSSPHKPSTSNKPSSQRNYKNMSKERRIEANARERTRGKYIF